MLPPRKPSLLSDEAQRLLDLLSPEPTPISPEQTHDPAVMELLMYGLVVVGTVGPTYAIRLSKAGRSGHARVN